MLAKIWKKFLLAVCIIACIYNIMSKLVNRASLEANLQKANDGNTVFDFSTKKSTGNTSEIVDGVINKNNTTSIQNEVIKNEVYNVVVEEDTTNENISENSVEEEQVPNEEEPNNTDDQKEDKSSSIINFKDYIFNW